MIIKKILSLAASIISLFILQFLFLVNSIAQDNNINSAENIFRPEDPEFGIKIRPDVLLLSGLQAKTLSTFQTQMEQNHANKKLFFGVIFANLHLG